MLPLDDERYQAYEGGYRVPYDIRPLVRELESKGTSESFWETVWNELHHQGDVGEASYALVPFLVEYEARTSVIDHDLLEYVTVVELQLQTGDNPPIPREFDFPYAKAVRRLPYIAAEKLRRGCSETSVTAVAAITAVSLGHTILARAYLELNTEEALVYLAEKFGYERSKGDF